MRNTQNLNSILAVFADGPKTPIQVQKILGIDKSVIYRTIERLKDNKKIQEVQLADGTVAYELTEKGHHHHLICTNCNNLECTQLPKGLAKEIQKFEGVLSAKMPVIDHRVDFFVVCKNCK